MNIYLDNCCFNRPFDDRSQVRIRREAEAVLAVQEALRARQLGSIWSCILDCENQQNPIFERRIVIGLWRGHAVIDVGEEPNSGILLRALKFVTLGFRKMDALHLACAAEAGADCFPTTDDGMISKAQRVAFPVIMNPVDFVNEVLRAH